MPAPPDIRLVAPERRAVEPLVHAPEAVESARVGGVRVVDDAIVEDERAHARPLARVGRRIGPAHRREDLRPLAATLERFLAVVVVVDASVALLCLREADGEV